MNVICVVVTYNRKELLQECLDALLQQTLPLSKIIVFNNHSTDDTEKLFVKGAKYDLPIIELVSSKTNLGGAGGFKKGIELATYFNGDWVWIMDDDTIPDPTALEELLASASILEKNKEKIGFLASYVYGPNGVPMNVPQIDMTTTKNGYSFWYRYLDFSMVSIKEATFVSILVPKESIKKVGYPIAEYFIWGDDCEYTQRLVKLAGNAYLCGKSKVLHKRFNMKKITIISENNKGRVKNYWHYYRNMLENSKKYEGKVNTFVRWIYYFALSIYCLFKPGLQFHIAKFCAIQRGVWTFIFKPM